ncbi:MAG: hypothetical protein LiPW15_294 [Parcubacteria group bacterium LiPW_15]|nr:MAG: hypothetical protein LiPW15_294 [Parcubacteria group bacterium LiPW_15]
MKIVVGSKNSVKVDALKEIILKYPDLEHAEVSALEVDSKVSAQPKSLEETIRGAMNRAIGSFADCDYSFGIEAGLMVVPNTKTGHMNVCACAIYDGKGFHLGLSSAWEAPKKVVECMLKDGLDMNQAVFKTGLTTNPHIGSAEGLVGIITKGRLNRKEYTKEAIRAALIHIENA